MASRPCQRAVRLLVAEAPQRRQFRPPGEARPLAHDHRRILGCHHEQIDRQSERRDVRRRRRGRRAASSAGYVCRRGQEFALVAGEVEAPVRLVDIHGPPAGPNQPRDGNAAAEVAQVVAPGAAHHAFGIAAAIELRAAFAQPQDRSGAGRKVTSACLFVDPDLLHPVALGRLDREGQRIGREHHPQIPQLDVLRARGSAERRCRCCEHGLRQACRHRRFRPASRQP